MKALRFVLALLVALVAGVVADAFRVNETASTILAAQRSNAIMLVTPPPYVYAQTVTVDVGTARAARLVCAQGDTVVLSTFGRIAGGLVNFVLGPWDGGDATCVVEVGTFQGNGSWNPRTASDPFAVIPVAS